MAMFCKSAFLSSREINAKMVRARNFGERRVLIESEDMTVFDVMLQRFMSSKRQSTKWSHLLMKLSFGILELYVSPDSEMKRHILTVCAHLLSIRTRMVKLNWIWTLHTNPIVVCNPWVVCFKQKQNQVQTHEMGEAKDRRKNCTEKGTLWYKLTSIYMKPSKNNLGNITIRFRKWSLLNRDIWLTGLYEVDFYFVDRLAQYFHISFNHSFGNFPNLLNNGFSTLLSVLSLFNKAACSWWHSTNMVC